jgi:hypothetical protein
MPSPASEGHQLGKLLLSLCKEMFCCAHLWRGRRALLCDPPCARLPPVLAGRAAARRGRTERAASPNLAGVSVREPRPTWGARQGRQIPAEPVAMPCELAEGVEHDCIGGGRHHFPAAPPSRCWGIRCAGEPLSRQNTTRSRSALQPRRQAARQRHSLFVMATPRTGQRGASRT